MHVHNPDHHIVARGTDRMVLEDHHTGEAVVTAERVPVMVGGPLGFSEKLMWVVGGHGVPNRQVEERWEALALMPHMAFDVLGPSGPNDEGYITLTPHGLADMP